MTTPTEVLPLLVVVFLLVSAGGGSVSEMTLHFEGDRQVETVEDVLVVAGGTATVPSNASATGDLYVVDGNATVRGTIDGDVTVLGGTLAVEDGGRITGTLQEIAGTVTVADGARVGGRSSLPAPSPQSPAEQAGFFLLQFLVLALGAVWLARRHPDRLATVGQTVGEHPTVSVVVGVLAALTLLVLFVYMAFTLVLIPVAVLGLLGEFLVVLLAYVVYGHWIGRRLPIERVDVATVAGLLAFMLVIEALARIPILGGLLQLVLLAAGFGAVLLTYFGLRPFEPAAIPEVG